VGASHLPSGNFANTRWSLVAALDSRRQRRADPLLELCLRNWYSVYAYLRRCGHAPETAQALTQPFFDHLLNRGSGHADGERFGRFREFLLAELHAFLSAERAHCPTTRPRRRWTSIRWKPGQRQDSVHAGTPSRRCGAASRWRSSGMRSKRCATKRARPGGCRCSNNSRRFLTAEPKPANSSRSRTRCRHGRCSW
jgi:hypothetical protein